jgi:hypothetical protein
VVRWTYALLCIAACGGTKSSSPSSGPDAVPATDAAVMLDAPDDPCAAVTPVCTAVPSGYAAGDGMRVVDRCAFPLSDRGQWTDHAALVDALPASVARVTLADVANDLNRTATRVTSVPGNPPGLTRAFQWQSGDETVAYWTPQGITGSFDGRDDGLVDGKKLVLVSWYYDQASDPGSTADKGVRIAIADVTDPANVRYRFALLVEPIAKGGRTDFAPIAVHAGGLAWIGDYLYVPVTGTGFRVFDLSRILRVDTAKDVLGYDAATDTYYAHSYSYAIPQVGMYSDAGTCAPVFSFVALDRSTTPPTLVSGEYAASSLAGRLYRWPLDASGRLVVTSSGHVIPDGAWFEGQSNVQGAMARADTFWLSSSAPAGAAGALYRTRVGHPSTTLGWIDSPEDLAFDPQLKALWSLSEGNGARYVIASSLSAISP